MGTRLEKIYNHDLLVHDSDREWVAEVYPELEWIVIDPQVRQKFSGIHGDGTMDKDGGFDGLANKAKNRARQIGICAIVLATAALMFAAAEPLGHGEAGTTAPWAQWLGRLAAAFGIVGGLLGALGVLRGKTKDRWLRHRMLTERIRQAYFQFLIRRAVRIAAAASKQAQDQLLQERNDFWRNFERTYEDASQDWIASIIEDDDHTNLWLIRPVDDRSGASVGSSASKKLNRLFDFYREQRFEQQVSYARHMQRTDNAIFSSAPRSQIRTIASITFSCVAGLFVIHIALGIAAGAGVHTGSWGALAHVIAVCLALAALSAKTFEEGLRPQREIERHRAYERSIRRLQGRFDAAGTEEEKIICMEEMESLAYWEMREFMRNHDEARFSI